MARYAYLPDISLDSVHLAFSVGVVGVLPVVSFHFPLCLALCLCVFSLRFLLLLFGLPRGLQLLSIDVLRARGGRSAEDQSGSY